MYDCVRKCTCYVYHIVRGLLCYNVFFVLQRVTLHPPCVFRKGVRTTSRYIYIHILYDVNYPVLVKCLPREIPHINDVVFVLLAHFFVYENWVFLRTIAPCVGKVHIGDRRTGKFVLYIRWSYIMGLSVKYILENLSINMSYCVLKYRNVYCNVQSL